jgi:hypothetical protein
MYHDTVFYVYPPCSSCRLRYRSETEILAHPFHFKDVKVCLFCLVVVRWGRERERNYF